MNKYITICIAIGGFIFNWLAFYPGFMYIDTLDQYIQATSSHYTDWHPPIMAGFWSLLNLIYKGPQSMLFFQLLLLWSSFYIIATTWCKHYVALLSLLLLLICAPYVQNFAGLIVKDTQMALSWLLATAIMINALYYSRKMTTAESLLTFLLITYGTIVRINALPGSFPLYFLWIDGAFSGSFKRKTFLLAAALTSLVIVKVSLEKFVLKAHKQYAEYKLMAHDIAGIYARTGHNYFPAFITHYPGFDSNYIAIRYTTATLDNIWWNNDNKKIFPPLNEQTRKELVQAWKHALQENKAAYLKNHYDGFLYYLQLKRRPGAPFYYYYPYIHPNKFGFAFKENLFSKIVLGSVRINSRLPYMKPWWWLLCPVILLVIALRLPSTVFKEMITCLCLSSLLYLLPQFFIYQADTEFRYFYWCCIATSFSTVLLIVYFLKKKTPAARRSSKKTMGMG